MLLYDVCYLAHTQAVEIPLSQAGDVLSNLWAVCCSAELGRSADPLLIAAFPLMPIVLLGDLTKPTRYSRHPRRQASSLILDNYSRPLLRRDHAPHARGQVDHTRIGITYPKRTSGTSLTMQEQAQLNSLDRYPRYCLTPPYHLSVSLLFLATPLSTVAYLCTLVSPPAHLRPLPSLLDILFFVSALVSGVN